MLLESSQAHHFCSHVFSPSSLAVGSWIECGMELTAKGPVATRVSIKDVDANQICGQVTNVSDTGCGRLDMIV